MTAKTKPFGIHNVQEAFKTKSIIPIRNETKAGGGDGLHLSTALKK